MRYFEDLRLGDSGELGSHTFTAAEIKAYAVKFDPQPFHLDESAAALSHFGALTASGWHTVAIWMRLFLAHWDAMQARAGEPPAEAGPSPGIRDLRWPKPVQAGDVISYRYEIVELRDQPKRPGWGLMVALNTAVNQKGEQVLSFRAAKFIKKRS